MRYNIIRIYAARMSAHYVFFLLSISQVINIELAASCIYNYFQLKLIDNTTVIAGTFKCSQHVRLIDDQDTVDRLHFKFLIIIINYINGRI